MYLVIPSLAALAQAHSLLPPQPGPVALMTSLNADSGLVYIFGIITLIPSIIAAGIILPRFLGGLDQFKMPLIGNVDDNAYEKLKVPNFAVSLLIPLLPAFLMVGHTVAAAFLPKEHPVVYVLNFLGSPIISLFLALLVALYVFGIRAGRTFAEASNSISSAIKGISVVVLIIGAGGASRKSSSPLVSAITLPLRLRVSTSTHLSWLGLSPLSFAGQPAKAQSRQLPLQA